MLLFKCHMTCHTSAHLFTMWVSQTEHHFGPLPGIDVKLQLPLCQTHHFLVCRCCNSTVWGGHNCARCNTTSHTIAGTAFMRAG